MKKKTLLLSMLVFGTMQGNAQDQKQKKSLVSNTTISLFSNQNFGSYIFNEKEGQISTGNKSSRFGFGISEDFYILPNDMYLSVGLRYYETSSSLQTKTSVYGIDPTSGHNYTVNYDHLVVPVYVGKTFKLFKDSKAYLNTFGGLSAGVSKIVSAQCDANLRKSNNDDDLVFMSYPKVFELGNFGFYSSIDLGFRVTPLNFPNLTVGATASLDITKSQSFSDKGWFGNDSKEILEPYKFDFTRRFVNVMLQVNYTFGRKWKNSL